MQENNNETKLFQNLSDISAFCEKNKIGIEHHRVLYVLALSDGCFYVGQTAKFFQRMKRHFISKKQGSGFSGIHLPLDLREVIDMNGMSESECSVYETAKVILLQNKYGIANVRGGAMCFLEDETIYNWLKKNDFFIKDGKCYLNNEATGKFHEAIYQLSKFPCLFKK